MSSDPSILVFTTLFPSSTQPTAGVFIRERLFRVAATQAVTVVAPVPWFPLQGLIRRFRPHFRPWCPRQEVQQGIEVLHPRFFSVPGVFKWLDGFSLAVCSWWTVRRQCRLHRVDIIDSHFAYPDGYAASLLARWLGLPFTITLRGTEVRIAGTRYRRRLQRLAMTRAARVFTVSESLRQVALAEGIAPDRVQVIGNGVDSDRFHAVSRTDSRAALSLPPTAKVLVSVGGLVERKGFHRVIELLPALREEFPELHYLVVGGAGPEGDFEARLRQQVVDLELQDAVHFLGSMPPDDLKQPLSASDVFVLATRNEGWANVFLEAMACGLPVVTTRVGGNAEVVCRDDVGQLVEFGDAGALAEALRTALRRGWDQAVIRQYAVDNHWDRRVAELRQAFRTIAGSGL